MAAEWGTKTVSELQREGALLVEDGNHGEYRPRPDEFVDAGIAFIRAADMDAGRVLFNSASKINDRARQRITKGIGAPGDVLLSHKGTVGKVALVPEDAPPFVCSPQTTFWRTLDNVRLDRRYLYAFLRSPEFRDQLGTRSGETDMAPYVSLTSQRGLSVMLPPLPEQRAIAHILGTLDDKIELNRRMSETLEAMARALFKSWFIDFDPVRRNAARDRNQPSPRSPLPVGEGRRGEGAKHEGDGHYRGGYDFPGMLETARELRRKQTPPEEIFWELVRARRFLGMKFRRQHQLGDYIADFYCHEHRLVVELDGGGHLAKREKDHKRNAWMQAQGFTVMRFPNDQLLGDPESVLDAIVSRLPSPPGRRAGDEGVIEGSAFDHLFPARLVDSELGEIPEGWEVGKFGDVVGQLRDSENPLDSPDVVFSHFSIPAFDDGQWPKCELGESIKSVKSRVPPGVVLLSKLNPEIERVWLVDVEPGTRAICSTEFLVLAPRAPHGRAFVYCLARSPLFRQDLEGLVTGTSKSHQRAHVGSILGLSVARPAPSLLSRFEGAAEPLLARSLECRRESRTLAALRDTLLPKLISGELRIRDAERFVAKAALETGEVVS